MSSGDLQRFYQNLQNNDLLYKYQFVGTIDGIDEFATGGIKNLGDDIKYYFQSSQIPGTQLSVTNVAYFGTQFRAPGVKQFRHNWSSDILLLDDFAIYDSFKNWHSSISNLNMQGGGEKKVSEVKITLNLLNKDGEVDKDHCWHMEGVWIKTIGELQLAYANGGSDPAKFKAEFRYQYVWNERNPADELV